MIFGKKGVIGIDIGSSAIKLAELKDSRKGFELKSIGEALLPENSIINKVIAKNAAVSETIVTLLQDLGVKSKNVAISISGNSVIIKKVTLPKMSESELKESIPWELEQYLPQSIEDVNYDFQVLPNSTDDGNMDVLIVAAKKDIANSYISLVSSIGLNPIVLDVDAFALENTYEINYEREPGILALANIGASVTNINVLKNGVSVFTRDVSVGGNQFTEWLMKDMNLSYEESEQKKYTLNNDDKSDDLDRISNDFVDLLTGEIKRTLDFFSSNFWKEKVNKMIISGGSSKVPNTKEVLEEITDIPVEILNPFRNISYSNLDFDPKYLSEIAPKMGVAVGLASRRFGDG
ncbi:MAG: type IV pilus biogenesis protein PilM [Thermodesulfobacteriota bacterium]